MRRVPIAELEASGHYADMAPFARHFHHAVVEDDEGVWRWEQDSLVNWLFHSDRAPFCVGRVEYRGTVDLNGLFVDLCHGHFTVESHMRFYMGLGYSLCGFSEVYGQRVPSDIGLLDGEGDETLLEYVVRKWEREG